MECLSKSRVCPNTLSVQKKCLYKCSVGPNEVLVQMKCLSKDIVCPNNMCPNRVSIQMDCLSKWSASGRSWRQVTPRHKWTTLDPLNNCCHQSGGRAVGRGFAWRPRGGRFKAHIRRKIFIDLTSVGWGVVQEDKKRRQMNVSWLAGVWRLRPPMWTFPGSNTDGGVESGLRIRLTLQMDPLGKDLSCNFSHHPFYLWTAGVIFV
jgi:hypothetical protein